MRHVRSSGYQWGKIHWNVFNCASDNCIIFFNIDTSARWEWLRAWVGAVAIETTREAAIVFNVLGEVGDWKTPFVETKGWWAVVAFGKWIVEYNCV